MLTLQVKVVSVSILLTVLFYEKSVNANLTSTNAEFDFREVVKENSQYSPMHDMCPLRILGGRTVDIEEVPYQILIIKCDSFGDFWKLVCGGSVITRQHVVSAAHCFQIAAVRRYYRVVAGTGRSYMLWHQKLRKTGLQKSTTTEVWRKILSCFVHKFYSRKRYNHDFAVLKLEFPVNFSRAVQPIPMLKPSHGFEIKDDAKCLVTGFGLMEKSSPSRHLRMVCVPFITRTRCIDFYGKKTVTANQFCAGDWGKDSCEGDSGGPITYRGYLIGIVSSGGICGQTPGIYTMISAYTSGDEIPLVLSHCVMLSVNILRILCFVFLIFVHSFTMAKLFTI